MKKIYTLLSVLAVTGFSFAQTNDSFTGTGALNANGWTTHSGTAGQLTISSGSLSYPGITSAGGKVALADGNNEDVNKASASPITGTAYYSAIINVPNTTALGANSSSGNYFLMNSATAGNGTDVEVTTFIGRLYIRSGAGTDTFNLGVLNNSGGTATPSYVSTDYAVNTPLLVVVKYEISTNTASLFINPAAGSTEPSATVTNATGTSAAPTQVAAIAIRQAFSNGAGTGNVEIDEVKLGTSWASVTAGTANVKDNAISGLKMFPNPLTGSVLNITSNNNDVKTVAIFDVLGKQVVNTKTTTGAVNVANLSSGVYMVKITEAGKTSTRKLVVK